MLKPYDLIFINILIVFLLVTACGTNGSKKNPEISDLVTLDQALAGAAEDIGFRVHEKKEIVIAEFTAPSGDLSDFLNGELSSHLIKSGKFIVL